VISIKETKMDDKLALFNPIKEKVIIMRGQMVILDRDLAGLYGVETKYLKRQVDRNPARFEGEDFMFQLTKLEFDEILRCQNVTSRWGGQRYLPYAFSESGISELSSVLNSHMAIRVNRQIMRYFVYARKAELIFGDFRKYVETKFKSIDDKFNKHDLSFEVILSLLDSFKKRIDLPQKSTGKYGFKKHEEKKDNIGLKSRETH